MTNAIQYYGQEAFPYTQGRGKVYVRYPGKTAWRDTYHVKEFKVAKAVEELKHENVSSKMKYVDASVITKMEITGGFTLDVPSLDNVKDFLSADDYTEDAQTSGTLSAVEYIVETPGCWHDLGKRKLTITKVTDDTSPTPVDLVEGTDYLIDLDNGMFLPIPTSNKVGTAGDKYQVTGTYATHTKKQLKAGTKIPQRVEILYLGDPSIGKRQNIYCYGLLKGTGDFVQIGEEWQQLAYEFTCYAHSTYGKYGLMWEDIEDVAQS